jgi:phospholipid/cholesterol/gamma-HCH transport system ATP-binding protein
MIEIKNLSKRFDQLVILDRVNFTVRDATLVVVLGPSGTGKTVLLKSMIGLSPIDSGEVIFDGKSVQSATEEEIYEIRQNIGYVFQGTALFDSMNVRGNIGLSIFEHTNLHSKQISERVTEILEIVGMVASQYLYPQALSGGMKRLIAIARALALDPKYIFYDEPTTGLDPVMTDRVVELIINLKKNYKKSGIVVTHDLETAKAVGDEIYMLKRGNLTKLEKIGKEFYD